LNKKYTKISLEIQENYKQTRSEVLDRYQANMISNKTFMNHESQTIMITDIRKDYEIQISDLIQKLNSVSNL